jgi:hypothetical protein
MEMIIVTGSDAKFFELAKEAITSIEVRRPPTEETVIGFLDFGVTASQRRWLLEHGVVVKEPETGIVLPPGQNISSNLGYLARPFMRENFPGHDIYIWIDADVWLQDWAGVEALRLGAMRSGAALINEGERCYRFWPWLIGWHVKHFTKGYGLVPGLWLSAHRHINNGVFAMLADAPHWDRWKVRYQRAFDRSGLAAPHDQFSLNAAVYLDRLPKTILSAEHNWICHLAMPMWNSEMDVFCVPRPPFKSIMLIHLAGPVKSGRFSIKSTDGTVQDRSLRYGEFRAASDRAENVA